MCTTLLIAVTKCRARIIPETHCRINHNCESTVDCTEINITLLQFTAAAGGHERCVLLLLFREALARCSVLNALWISLRI